MAFWKWGRVTLTALGLFALAACGYSVQTTSGRDYLQNFEDYAASATQGPDENSGAGSRSDQIHQALHAAAAVEPILTFPARFGLARIDRGGLTPIPESEAAHWRALAADLGPGWGEFVPISPLIAAFTHTEVAPLDQELCHGWRLERNYADCLGQVVHGIRLGAARQHVDAVLVYEGTAWSKSAENALGLAKLTIVGFWLAPTESIEAGAAAQALLLDVRNGYTYGHAQSELLDSAETITPSVGSSAVADDMRGEALNQAVAALVPQVKSMLYDLRLQLAEGN
ncbi:MAG: hypothetical protein AAF530_21790 [Pseudomonadota bacterium]